MATIHRSAKTGRIVTAKKAAKRPGTTVKETVTAYERNKKAVVSFLLEVSKGTYGELTTRKLAGQLYNKIR